MGNKILIGVDFGGTKILTGAMTERGEVLCEPVKVPTNGSEEAEKIIKRLKDSISEVLRKSEASIDHVKGIGLGVTGPLDIRNGVILECPQLPSLHFFPLKQNIQDHFHLPVHMNNDANCLIYGEVLFGSGTGKKNVVGFTLGTGLGCAIILDGKIFAGSTESAGEIWPSPFQNTTIEDFVSGAGISRAYKEMTGEDKSALDVALLAKGGSASALKTWEIFGEQLGVAVSWAINLIDPEVVILGGSISNAYEFFSAAMQRTVRKHVCPRPAQATRIVSSKLGANAGFIGAAALVI